MLGKCCENFSQVNEQSALNDVIKKLDKTGSTD